MPGTIIAIILNLIFIIGSFFSQTVFSYIFLAVFVLFAAYLQFMLYSNRNLNRAGVPDFTDEEFQLLKKFYLPTRYMFGCRTMSQSLNIFRYACFFWIGMSIFSKDHIFIAILVVLFLATSYYPKMFDPFIVLGRKKRFTSPNTAEVKPLHEEYELLNTIYDKFWHRGAYAKRTNEEEAPFEEEMMSSETVQVEDDELYCKKCKVKLTGEKLFCVHCGTKVSI